MEKRKMDAFNSHAGNGEKKNVKILLIKNHVCSVLTSKALTCNAFACKFLLKNETHIPLKKDTSYRCHSTCCPTLQNSLILLQFNIKFTFYILLFILKFMHCLIEICIVLHMISLFFFCNRIQALNHTFSWSLHFISI